jgi:chorismate synthase
MNTLGKKLVFTSFGESHGAAVGGVLDGVRAGVKIDMDLVRKALDKRAGRSQEEAGVSPRAAREQDAVEWLSGVMDGVSLGTPIAFVIRNKDARPGDYDWLKESYRVGHADEVYAKKYGIRDHRGGGRASARETAARVVAGSLAQQLLREKGIDVRAELVQVGTETDPDKFKEYILGIQRDGDSIGGIVECHITGLPAGIGEPIFDKLQSHLAFAMMSINACKGFEYGSGFGNIGLRGSEMYLSGDERLISGGIAGGISDGKEVVFRCVFKPTATNRKILEATHADAPAGRHDACIAVRAVAVVEAMAALVVADLMEEMEEMK